MHNYYTLAIAADVERKGVFWIHLMCVCVCVCVCVCMCVCLGSVQAYKSQFRKCTGGEFFRVGDMVKAEKKFKSEELFC